MAMSTLRLVIIAILLNSIWLLTISSEFNWQTIGNTDTTPQNIITRIESGQLNDTHQNAQGALSQGSKDTAAQPGTIAASIVTGKQIGRAHV